MSTPIASQGTAVDDFSLMTTPVLLLKDGKPVSQGTGFFFATSDASSKPRVPFLVTNYHVLTGYAPGESGPKKGDAIRFFLHRDRTKPALVKQIDFPLYAKTGDPVWISSAKNLDADIAMIPLADQVLKDANVIVFVEQNTKSNMKIGPTSAVTLIGYPYGYFDTTNFLPIWKGGTIASEPDWNFQGKRMFVVDVAAFPGMSGSPVIAIASGVYPGKDGATVVGGVRQLLGIFASVPMHTENKFLEELAAQKSKLGIVQNTSLNLGHVWKSDLIVEIAESFDVADYTKRILNKLK